MQEDSKHCARNPILNLIPCQLGCLPGTQVMFSHTSHSPRKSLEKSTVCASIFDLNALSFVRHLHSLKPPTATLFLCRRLTLPFVLETEAEYQTKVD